MKTCFKKLHTTNENIISLLYLWYHLHVTNYHSGLEVGISSVSQLISEEGRLISVIALAFGRNLRSGLNTHTPISRLSPFFAHVEGWINEAKGHGKGQFFIRSARIEEDLFLEWALLSRFNFNIHYMLNIVVNRLSFLWFILKKIYIMKSDF